MTDALRTAIILGELEEGRLYSAPTLAGLLGVSATPVREAMMDLDREGLVETAKNKGFRVTRMTRDDLEEQTQLRQLLEAPAMRAVAGLIPPEDLEELGRLADTIAEAADQGDLRTYLIQDREFHRHLVSYTGNQRLVDLTFRLRGQTRLRALRELAESGRLIDSAREHHRLLEVLQASDGDGAFELTMRHIGHASRLWSTGSETRAEQERPLVDLFPHSDGHVT
ncbi:MAG: GntR family transcriptional regulator [Brachybacterium sp.]|nr:GntR family transcriptional regulator [Brachybacterium sp.]